MAEPEAVELADRMNAEHRLHQAPPTPPDGARWRAVSPVRSVLIHAQGKWWPGYLDYWMQGPDGWYGRAVFAADDNGVVSWYAARDLRAADQ